ncbi:MAG: FAD-dependent oxidoreductase [Oscillospiraceae bacterium]|jgi:thioredoxin reductase (NADPH)|nr:FAD-dependent oxidoreductase [Oscillospiraceae bacterium]
MKDLIVIGGGCAGLTAALYAARAGKSVLLFEAENIGGQITSAPFVDNYPGLPHVSGMQFADNLFAQVTELGVEVELEKVTGIEHKGETNTVVTEEGRYDCSNVIIATGAKHKRLGLPDEERLIGHGVSYCAVCDGAFYKGRTAAVVGGGNTAFCDALFLSNLCSKVVVIHRRVAFRADAAMAERLRCVPNIEFITETVVDAIIGDNEVTGLRLKSLKDGHVYELTTDVLFVAIGHVPDSMPFSSLVEIDSEGYIVAGEDCQTGVAGVFAAGDCRRKSVRQLTTAVADGANAAVGAWSCPVV